MSKTPETIAPPAAAPPPAALPPDGASATGPAADLAAQNSRCRAELAAMRESALDCIIVMDDRGRIAEFNPAAERTFGHRREDVIGRDLAATIIPPALVPLHREGLARFLGGGEGPALNRRIEVTAVRAGGAEFPVELAVTPFFLDGRPTFVAYLRDITEQKRARDENRHAAKLALVASRTDNAVIITDVQGRIEWANEGFTRISGYTLDEVRGRKPGAVLQGPGTDPATVAYVRSQLARGEGFQVEILNYAKDGREYWLAAEVQPVRDADGRLTQFMAIESDITERKRANQELRQAKESAERARAEAEEARAAAEAAKAGAEASRSAAEAANRAKSEFLANMSHEIRTPLNGVIGMTDLLLGTDLAPAQHRFAAIARSSATTLLAVINQILDFSKIEAGKLELESIDFSPRTVVEEVAEMLAHKAAARNLDLAHQVADGVPAVVRGDPDRLRQVLINLVNNAVKFTEHGEVVVRVGPEEPVAGCPLSVAGGPSPRGEPNPSRPTADNPRPTTDDGRLTRLRFDVIDSGVGIPPDRVGRLFKSFSQVDASTTRRHGGTGLGLAICKQLVELMGGRIGVRANGAGAGPGGGAAVGGRGSTFWFTACFAAAGQATAAGQTIPAGQTTAAGPGVAPDLRGLRVLAVDDNAACLRILAGQLESWGMRVRSAGGGAEATSLVARASEAGEPFDVALVDMLMPDANGADLARAMGGAGGNAATRLVLMSAADNPVDAARAREAGFAGCVSKPIRASQLFDEIIRVMAAVPVAAGGGAARPAAAAPQVGSPPPARDALVLLAEDNEVNQMVAVEILARAGYRCEVVSDGEQAVRAACGGRYDLVLMDCQMPEMDGFEATQAIRRWEAGGRDGSWNGACSTGKDRGLPAAAMTEAPTWGRRIPIIALTANAIKGDRERCLEAGMDDYLSKPLDPKRLIERIGAALERSGPRVAPAGASSGGAPPGAAPAGGAPFDVRDLLSRCMGDAGFLERVLAKFREQSAALLRQLDEGVAGSDADRVARVAHGIKGAAANLSAAAAAGLAGKLEELGRAGAVGGAGPAVRALRAEVQRCIDWIPAAVSEAAASGGRD